MSLKVIVAAGNSRDTFVGNILLRHGKIAMASSSN